MCALVGVLVGPALENGHYQDFDVEPQTPAFDVVPVVLDTRHHVADIAGFTTKSIDLRPTRDAGLD